MNLSHTQEFTEQEVKDNNYVIIDNNVYNFKEFEDKHPGGAKVLIHYRGGDATKKFHQILKHTDKVKQVLPNFQIGILRV
jgi:cytochrome b involved in lipid metabolism